MASTSSHRIVCVTTEHPHRHIVDVGTGTDPQKASQRWTVKEVRDAIDNGDTFHTKDSKGNIAAVLKDTCRQPSCTVQTIRSTADASTENNLDNLRTCRWRD